MVHLLEEYALNNNIPIMQKEGINFLVEYIKKNNIKSILEIGSAIGYSAIMMATVDKNIQITTIEKDYDRYLLALKNISDFKLDKQIKVICGDALETKIDGLFDLIFIDGPKSQYLKFFQKYCYNLNQNGAIITDNLSFHGLVGSDTTNLSRNLKGLIKKISEYIKYLKDNKEFTTEFLSIGDGISISKKSS